MDRVKGQTKNKRNVTRDEGEFVSPHVARPMHGGHSVCVTLAALERLHHVVNLRESI